jgi:hypothetical protein
MSIKKVFVISRTNDEDVQEVIAVVGSAEESDQFLEKYNKESVGYRAFAECFEVDRLPTIPEMRKWVVTGTVVGGVRVGEYMARNASEAIHQAERDAGISLCHACSKQCSDLEIESFHAELVAE